MSSHPYTLVICLHRLKIIDIQEVMFILVLKEVGTDSAPWSTWKLSTFHWLNAFSAIFLTWGTVLHSLCDVLGDSRPPHGGGHIRTCFGNPLMTIM